MQQSSTRERRLRVSDGAELVYHSFGEGPPVVLANGLGGTFRAFLPLCAPLVSRYRFLTWDYRGLFRSGAPPAGGSYDVARQARDLFEILDAEGVERAALVGWSMGVQVSLDAYRQAPGRVLGIAALNGTFGAPLQRASLLGPLRFFLPIVLERSTAILPRLEPFFHPAVRWRRVTRLAQLAGVISSSADEEPFYQVAQDFIALDLGRLVKTLLALNEHDARELLPSVRTPALIITGSNDLMTPPKAARHMAESIPGAEFLEVPSGTHYTPLEFPELVGMRLEKFLVERVFA
jgi:pimeloyl-ACP methyl ester carboxylesterase